MRLATVVSVAGLSAAMLGAMPSHAAPIFVELGSTYLRSAPGQLITGGLFGGTIFDPTPGPHGANIIITRPDDIEINGSPGVIRLTYAAMHSHAPVTLGTNQYDVILDLDPAHLADNLGTLTITGDLTGGTATESFTYFARLSLFDAVTHTPGPVQVIQVNSVSAAPFSWSPNPTPGAVLVTGPDPDDGNDDPLVSFRTGLDANEVNFFPIGSFQTLATGPSGGTTTTTLTARVPEPGTLLLVALTIAMPLRKWGQTPFR